jgi:OOP family OmpA-OmpF porin
MSSLSRRLASATAFALVTGLAATASAQASGFAIDHFNPSERGSDWFAEDSLDFRGANRPAIGLVAEYADRPLVIVNANGSTNSSPVKDQLILHPGASVVLFDRLRLAFDLPVVVFADGNAGAVTTTAYPATTSGGLGDLRVSADGRLYGKYGDPFTLAAGLSVFLPIGSTSAYASDGEVRVLPRVAVAGDLGIVAYAAHVGLQVRPVDNAFPGYPTGTEVDVGGSIGIRALRRHLLVGPEVYGSTVVTNASAAFSTRQTPVEGLLGVHYAFASDWRIGGGLGMGLTRGFGEPLVRGLLAIEWIPADASTLVDRDKDSIADDADACPDVAGVASEDPRRNGCPLPDRDHDGVPDALDACPDVPGVKTDDARTNGCPGDRDHDGIPDSEDACPDSAGVRMTDKATNGCAPDSDHDGIPDAEDACPDIPGVKTDDPKTNGCPNLDRDKDSIRNEEDACPDAAGPSDPDPKRNGCPEAFLQDDLLKLADPIGFDGTGATIAGDAETKRALEGALTFLVKHPEVKHVRVEGHTDNQGNANANRALAAQRAGSVISWLTAHGIAPSRVTSMGVGGDSPIQDNTTEEGRRANRRIELHVEP